MKLINMYKKGKEERNKISEMNISKKIATKTIIFTIIFDAIMAMPCISIVSALLTVFSPLRTMFWIILILICVFLAIVYASGAAFNVVLLKNYLETEEMKKIDTKSIFVRELFNPINLLIGIFIDFIIYLMAL
jgi:Kef-type K+ transport system membrane component KefB